MDHKSDTSNMSNANIAAINDNNSSMTQHQQIDNDIQQQNSGNANDNTTHNNHNDMNIDQQHDINSSTTQSTTSSQLTDNKLTTQNINNNENANNDTANIESYTTMSSSAVKDESVSSSSPLTTDQQSLDPIDDPNDLLYQAPLHLSELPEIRSLGRPTPELVFQQRLLQYMKDNNNISTHEICNILDIDYNYMNNWLHNKAQTKPYYTFRIITFLYKNNRLNDIEYGSKIYDWKSKKRHFLTLYKPIPQRNNNQINNDNSMNNSHDDNNKDITQYNEKYLYQLSDNTYDYPRCKHVINNNNNALCNSLVPLTCEHSMCGRHCYLHNTLCSFHPRSHAIDDYDTDNIFDNMPVNETTQTYNEVHGFVQQRSGLLRGNSRMKSTITEPLMNNTIIDYRTQCIACESYIGFNNVARIIQCPTCLTVQPITTSKRVSISEPLPSHIATNQNKSSTLIAQCSMYRHSCTHLTF